MTQRLTPETERAIRDRARASLGDAGVDRLLLLAEIDAIRAELAGAEERGAARERAAIGAWLYDVFAHAVAKYHLPGEAVRDAAEAIERGAHVRTSTTPPDEGESQP